MHVKILNFRLFSALSAEEEDEITRYTAACPGGGASPLSLTPLRTLHSQKAAGESKRKDSVWTDIRYTVTQGTLELIIQGVFFSLDSVKGL